MYYTTTSPSIKRRVALAILAYLLISYYVLDMNETPVIHRIAVSSASAAAAAAAVFGMMIMSCSINFPSCLDEERERRSSTSIPFLYLT